VILVHICPQLSREYYFFSTSVLGKSMAVEKSIKPVPCHADGSVGIMN
jgi:hypothetical protein